MGTKINCMIKVLNEIYEAEGMDAVRRKVDMWQENGWIYPYEKRLLLDSIALRVPQYLGYIEKEKR